MLPRFSILLILMSAAANASIGTVDFDRATGSLEFRAVGRPSALKIVGKAGPPRGKLEIEKDRLTGSLTIDLDSLDTGVELRNHHMKEKYLQTKSFPKANLAIKSISIPLGQLKAGFSFPEAPFVGTLTLHGVDREVTGKIALKCSGDSVHGDATFQLKLSDFKIDVPSFAGIVIADLVDITTAFDAPLAAHQ
jgi:polyisoprenoid-binding protein YceI